MKFRNCPFCGAEPEVQSYPRNGWRYRVRCIAGDCPVQPKTLAMTSLELARSAWNGRDVLPNAPLTLEELREMDGEPVWSEYYQAWGIISLKTDGRWNGVPFFLFSWDGIKYEKNIVQRQLTLYRRRPEEGAHHGH